MKTLEFCVKLKGTDYIVSEDNWQSHIGAYDLAGVLSHIEFRIHEQLHIYGSQYGFQIILEVNEIEILEDEGGEK